MPRLPIAAAALQVQGRKRKLSRDVPERLSGVSEMLDAIPETATRTRFSTDLSGRNLSKKAEHSEKGHWFLGHAAFQGLILLAIASSGVQMGFETFLENPSEHAVLRILEHAFLIVFVFEMIIKLCCMRKTYFTDPEMGLWNLLDFFIVWVAILDMWIIPFFGTASSLSFIKVFRLLRLLRILKLIHNVPELKMVIEGMLASMKSMVWIILLLAAVMYILGILCVETIGRESSQVYPGRSESPEVIDENFVEAFNNYVYFGDLWRSLVTLLGLVLLAEWSSIVRPVWEMQPALIIVFCVLVFITTFGIFNVIVGVVVERTNEAMERARCETHEETIRKRMCMVEEMGNIAFRLDENGDGLVSHDEMEAIEENVRFHNLLQGVELPHGFTFSELHQMFDHDSSSDLSKTEFVLGMLRLVECNPFQQACLQQLMLAQVKAEVQRTQLELREVIRTLLLPEIAGIKQHMDTLAEAVGKPAGVLQPLNVRVDERQLGTTAYDQAPSAPAAEQLSGVWTPLPKVAAVAPSIDEGAVPQLGTRPHLWPIALDGGEGHLLTERGAPEEVRDTSTLAPGHCTTADMLRRHEEEEEMQALQNDELFPTGRLVL